MLEMVKSRKTVKMPEMGRGPGQGCQDEHASSLLLLAPEAAPARRGRKNWGIRSLKQGEKRRCHFRIPHMGKTAFNSKGKIKAFLRLVTKRSIHQSTGLPEGIRGRNHWIKVTNPTLVQRKTDVRSTRT